LYVSHCSGTSNYVSVNVVVSGHNENSSQGTLADCGEFFNPFKCSLILIGMTLVSDVSPEENGTDRA
jgi:hypothetical protein